MCAPAEAVEAAAARDVTVFQANFRAGWEGSRRRKPLRPFSAVPVFDRDLLPDEPAPRVGTPQAPHAHRCLPAAKRR